MAKPKPRHMRKRPKRRRRLWPLAALFVVLAGAGVSAAAWMVLGRGKAVSTAAWMALGSQTESVASTDTGAWGQSAFVQSVTFLAETAAATAEATDLEALEQEADREARAAETIEQRATESGVTAVTYPSVLTSQTWEELEAALATFTGKGYELGFVLIDLDTQMSLRFNQDALFYPASSAKAPYCAYIFETNGGAAGLSSTVRSCIVNSDNEAYRTLQKTFGSSGYAAWLTRLGAENPAKKAARYYPEFSAENLATVWQEIYRYGTSGEAGADELTGYLAQTTRSALRDAATKGTVVWNKAGWYPADGAGLQATNDAGIVFAPEGEYLLAVMSDAPSNFKALAPVVEALDAVHAEMRR